MPDQPVGLPLIQPQVHPGGVVLHVYATPSGQLLDTILGDNIAMASFAAGHRLDLHLQKLLPGDGLMLVAYSGDTGLRLADDGQPVCPHCGSGDMDRGGTALDMCRTCGGMSRYGVPLVQAIELVSPETILRGGPPVDLRGGPPVDLGDDADGDIEGYDGR
jgi:hypothetical protein